MATGTVIEVKQAERLAHELQRVDVVGEGDLQRRYDELVALSLRTGAWLLGPQARLLPAVEWEEQFERYQEHLEELRRLGDRLRPVSLRARDEKLAGDALVDEVLELFAA